MVVDDGSERNFGCENVRVRRDIIPNSGPEGDSRRYASCWAFLVNYCLASRTYEELPELE